MKYIEEQKSTNDFSLDYFFTSHRRIPFSFLPMLGNRLQSPWHLLFFV